MAHENARQLCIVYKFSVLNLRHGKNGIRLWRTINKLPSTCMAPHYPVNTESDRLTIPLLHNSQTVQCTSFQRFVGLHKVIVNDSMSGSHTNLSFHIS